MRYVRGGASIVGWALCLVVVILLWPAAYGGWITLTIVSGQSMEPTYRSGDLVVAWRADVYRPGDAVVYTVPEGQIGEGHRVIHRLVAEVDGLWISRGDNKSADDPWTPSDADILGRAWIHVPGAGVGIVTWLPITLAFTAGAFITAALWPRRRRRHLIETPPSSPSPATTTVTVSVLIAIAVAGVATSPGAAAALGGLHVERITSWSLESRPIAPSGPLGSGSAEDAPPSETEPW